jgi:hypothetical protein
MFITREQLQSYLEENDGKTTYFTTSGAPFTLKLLDPGRNKDIFCYSIDFSWPSWSSKTKRRIGPAETIRFLEIFNLNNDTPLSMYRNLGPKESPSARAHYPVPVFRILVLKLQQAQS